MTLEEIDKEMSDIKAMVTSRDSIKLDSGAIIKLKKRHADLHKLRRELKRELKNKELGPGSYK